MKHIALPTFRSFVNNIITDIKTALRLPLKMTYNDIIANKTTTITVEEGHRILRALWEIKDWNLATKLENQLKEAAYMKDAYPRSYKFRKTGDDPFFDGLMDDAVKGMWCYGEFDPNHWSGNHHILDYGKGYEHGRYGTVIGRSEYNDDDLDAIEKHLFWFLSSEMLWDKPVPEGTPKTIPIEGKGVWNREVFTPAKPLPLLLDSQIEELQGVDDLGDLIPLLVNMFHNIHQYANQSNPEMGFAESLSAQSMNDHLSDVERFAGGEDHGTFVVEIPSRPKPKVVGSMLTDEQKARRAYLQKKPKFETTITEGPKDPKDDR